jgi:hypothetical protein
MFFDIDTLNVSAYLVGGDAIFYGLEKSDGQSWPDRVLLCSNVHNGVRALSGFRQKHEHAACE